MIRTHVVPLPIKKLDVASPFASTESCHTTLKVNVIPLSHPLFTQKMSAVVFVVVVVVDQMYRQVKKKEDIIIIIIDGAQP